MIEFKGRTRKAEVKEEPGQTLLQLALKHRVDWGFHCTRGTCARCRCYIAEGRAYLAEPTDAEWDRLEPEELDEGYRLACQAVVDHEGKIIAVHRPYF